MGKAEELILEIKKTDDSFKKKELLELFSSLDILKTHQGLLFKNAWLDVFPDIIQSHKEYFKTYFSKGKVRESFRDYILSSFLKMMHYLNTTNEDSILGFSLWDTNQNEDGSITYTRNLIAKNYYKAIKIVDPELAEDIFQQTADRYFAESMERGESYYSVFKTLKTDYGKMFLVSRIMENLKVYGESINIEPVIELKKDLLGIFETCLTDRNQNLIYFVGEYLEYISMFTSTKGVKTFTDEVKALLDKYDQDEIVKKFREDIFL